MLFNFFCMTIIQCLVSVTHSGSGRNCRLNVSNDGPVTLDVPVTISAKLDCADNETKFLYTFEDAVDHTLIEVIGLENTSTSFIYSNGLGKRTVEVVAYFYTHPFFQVAATNTSFHVEEYISGTLGFSGIVEDKHGHIYIATDSDTNITIQLHYPWQILKDSEFSYSWNIGGQHFTTDKPFKAHRFSSSGVEWVRASAVGRIPSYDDPSIVRYKWGYFDADITVKDPFSSINISGNTYLEHGQLLTLDISCNGSGSIEYCWKVLPSGENRTNVSCTDPVSATECSFPILYYFRDSGEYLLTIYVNNLIASLQRQIQVHIYDVSLRPQLSTVIIPVACTVLVILIIARALVEHMRRQVHYDIETADFDFMEINGSTTSVAVETSWQVMRRSLMYLLQLRCLCHSTEREPSLSVSYGSVKTKNGN